MTETMQTIADIVSNFGFPIAATTGLFWYIIKKDAKHAETIDSLRQAIDNNTAVLHIIYERFKEVNK